MSLLGVIGDYFLKLAGEVDGKTNNTDLFVGTVIYGVTAFGWYYAMRYLKLESVGIVYSLTTVVLLPILGSLAFHEQIKINEFLGLLFSVLAILCLCQHY